MMKPKQDTRITFTHGRAQFRVQPKNAQRIRDALFTLDRAKPSKPKVGKGMSTGYPEFTPGMTTAEYIKQFQALNGASSGGTPEETKRACLSFVHADRRAPVLDLLVPEVIEEPDPDYVAATRAAKRSSGGTMAALHAKIAALEAEVVSLRQQLACDLV